VKDKCKNAILPVEPMAPLEIVPAEREGFFKEGHDKLGRPYEKKLDENGLYTKKEILKDGTRKLTIKKK
jgi:hypothetical protein